MRKTNRSKFAAIVAIAANAEIAAISAIAAVPTIATIAAINERSSKVLKMQLTVKASNSDARSPFEAATS